MNILLNGKETQISLDKEKSFQDVIHSLKIFFSEHKHTIKSIKLNSENIDLESIVTINIPIKDIKTLSITSFSLIDEIAETIPTLHLLIETLLESLKLKDRLSINKKEMIENLIWVINGTQTISEALSVPLKYIIVGTKDLEEILSDLSLIHEKFVIGIHDQNIYNDLFPLLKLTLNLLKDKGIPLLLDFYNFFFALTHSSHKNDIKTLFTNLIDPVKEIHKDLFKIVTFLQEGKNSEGFEWIRKSIIIYELLVMFQNKMKQLDILDNMESLNTLNQELSSLVTEITDSLENSDIVTICDLVEYEYIPKLQELINIVEDLFNI